MKKYIGIDVGGMSIKGGVVTEQGEILIKGSCPTQAGKPYTVWLRVFIIFVLIYSTK